MSTEKLHIWQKIGLFFYKQRSLTALVWIAVVLFGSISYTVLMRKEGFPGIEVPIGVIRVVALDGSAEVVDASYAQPIIAEVRKDNLVKEVSTTSSDQGATVQISFKDGSDVQ